MVNIFFAEWGELTDEALQELMLWERDFFDDSQNVLPCKLLFK